MKIQEPTVRKLIDVVDAGLCSGVGRGKPGDLCVMSAISLVLGEDPGSDQPTCVGLAPRAFGIRLNDAGWSDKKARARGMRRFGIASLGSNGIVSDAEFNRRIEAEAEAAAGRWEEAEAGVASLRDQVLSDFAEAAVQILADLKSPGAEFLSLAV